MLCGVHIPQNTKRCFLIPKGEAPVIMGTPEEAFPEGHKDVQRVVCTTGYSSKYGLAGIASRQNIEEWGIRSSHTDYVGFGYIVSYHTHLYKATTRTTQMLRLPCAKPTQPADS